MASRAKRKRRTSVRRFLRPPSRGVRRHLGSRSEAEDAQIDAPNHFAQGGRSLDQIRPDELIVPLVVIDFRERAKTDRDAAVSPADIEAWKATHGPNPDGACVMFNFGWAQYIGDARYIGLADDHAKHFPGISPEAARFLVARRNIWGVGVDTISFDPGPDGAYQTHRALLGADKWALEAVASLDRLPPVGATLFIGASKVRGATGGIVRLVASW
jgi:kynurenine formamidase